MDTTTFKQITKCLAFKQVTATGSPFNLPAVINETGLPAPTWVLIQAEAQDLRYRDDGFNPSGPVGMLIKAGDTLCYAGDLTKIKLVAATAGAIANILYYQ